MANISKISNTKEQGLLNKFRNLQRARSLDGEILKRKARTSQFSSGSNHIGSSFNSVNVTLENLLREMTEIDRSSDLDQVSKNSQIKKILTQTLEVLYPSSNLRALQSNVARTVEGFPDQDLRRIIDDLGGTTVSADVLAGSSIARKISTMPKEQFEAVSQEANNVAEEITKGQPQKKKSLFAKSVLVYMLISILTGCAPRVYQQEITNTVNDHLTRMHGTEEDHNSGEYAVKDKASFSQISNDLAEKVEEYIDGVFKDTDLINEGKKEAFIRQAASTIDVVGTVLQSFAERKSGNKTLLEFQDFPTFERLFINIIENLKAREADGIITSNDTKTLLKQIFDILDKYSEFVSRGPRSKDKYKQIDENFGSYYEVYFPANKKEAQDSNPDKKKISLNKNDNNKVLRNEDFIRSGGDNNSGGIRSSVQKASVNLNDKPIKTWHSDGLHHYTNLLKQVKIYEAKHMTPLYLELNDLQGVKTKSKNYRKIHSDLERKIAIAEVKYKKFQRKIELKRLENLLMDYRVEIRRNQRLMENPPPNSESRVPEYKKDLELYQRLYQNAESRLQKLKQNKSSSKVSNQRPLQRSHKKDKVKSKTKAKTKAENKAKPRQKVKSKTKPHISKKLKKQKPVPKKKQVEDLSSKKDRNIDRIDVPKEKAEIKLSKADRDKKLFDKYQNSAFIKTYYPLPELIANKKNKKISLLESYGKPGRAVRQIIDSINKYAKDNLGEASNIINLVEDGPRTKVNIDAINAFKVLVAMQEEGLANSGYAASRAKNIAETIKQEIVTLSKGK